MAVRLRQIYSLPPVELDVKLAELALRAFSSINLQAHAAPSVSHDDGTGYGLIFLALRLAGRVTDNQGVLETSQDVTDAHSILNEMMNEWQRERAVKVIPGVFASIIDLAAPLIVTDAQRSAMALNLGVRLRDWFGVESSKPLLDRAERALALLQAINLQQQPAPAIAGDDGTGYGILFLALRAAGRVNDGQGITRLAGRFRRAQPYERDAGRMAAGAHGTGHSRHHPRHHKPVRSGDARPRHAERHRAEPRMPTARCVRRRGTEATA
jgi:hypothetical protein